MYIGLVILSVILVSQCLPGSDVVDFLQHMKACQRPIGQFAHEFDLVGSYFTNTYTLSAADCRCCVCEMTCYSRSVVCLGMPLEWYEWYCAWSNIEGLANLEGHIPRNLCVLYPLDL